MNTYLVTNGTNRHLIEKSSKADAITWAQNNCDHSNEIKVQETFNLFDLKKGDKIKVYNSGKLVDGEVKITNPHWVQVETEPVQWGNDIYTEVHVTRPTELQRNYNGGLAVPNCWFNDKAIIAI